MKFILGTKEKMTQIFDEEGQVFPVTAIKVTPATVTQVKSKEKDGYQAVQFGYGTRKTKKLSKPVRGHLKDKSFAHLKEIRLDKAKDASKNMKSDWNVGDIIESSVFAAGDKVEISALSKGKGFQGVVKRHGFKGGPRSHGQKHSERAPGSIGTAGFQRVFKNMRMAGRMGGDRITFKNMKIVRIDGDQIFIEGAVPGRKGTLVEIKGQADKLAAK
jgi:large subunit ribosomal protein L3